MRNIVILCSSIALFSLGLLIEDRGLAMMLGRDGEPIYPISSGSEDGLLLKVGLFPFVISGVISFIAMFRGKEGRGAFWAYLAGSVFYALAAALVALDSDYVEAARIGDFLPLLTLWVWFISVMCVTWLTFNKKLQPTADASTE